MSSRALKQNTFASTSEKTNYFRIVFDGVGSTSISVPLERWCDPAIMPIVMYGTHAMHNGTLAALPVCLFTEDGLFIHTMVNHQLATMDLPFHN